MECVTVLQSNSSFDLYVDICINVDSEYYLSAAKTFDVLSVIFAGANVVLSIIAFFLKKKRKFEEKKFQQSYRQNRQKRIDQRKKSIQQLAVVRRFCDREMKRKHNSHSYNKKRTGKLMRKVSLPVFF